MSNCCDCNKPQGESKDKPCDGAKTLIFACSGGSNVGQITNDAAKKLDQEGLGNFFCLIGIPTGIGPIVANTKSADHIICLDGCAVACAKKALDDTEIPIGTYIIATECGIEKGHHFDIKCEEIETVCTRVREAL